MAKNFSLKLPEVEVGGLRLSLGLGGIHSVDEPHIYNPKDDYLLLDADVTSYYPQAIINYRICPEHLDVEVFLQTLIDALDDRKKYKSKKKEGVIYAALEYGLKIALNSVFGLFGYVNFLLFDLLCTYRTTVNNQLWLLKLIEMLSLRQHKVISANTDGVLLYIHKSELDSVNAVFKEWENKTGFRLEYAQYSLFVQRDVNNYLARKTDGTIKMKGDFVPGGAYLHPYYEYDLPRADNGMYLPIKSLLKGFQFPIVAIALQKYYLDYIDVETTIWQHRDIFDFCYSEKTGKQYQNYLYEISRAIVTHSDKGKEYTEARNLDETLSKTEVQRTLRFFVSRPTINDDGTLTGRVLKKVKQERKMVKVLLQQKQVIPAVYEQEQRINPDTGRLKTYKTKVSDRAIVPAIYEEVMQDVTTESVLASGCFVTLFNDYWHEPEFDKYNIDYDFYVGKCMQEIDKIGLIV